jgi:uncharacterized protein (DUF2267 family)
MANRPYDAKYEPRPGEQAREEQLRYQRFLGALARGGLGTEERAERAAVAVLSVLEQHLPGPEARDLNDELPWALRDLLRGAERHPKSRPERVGREELLARVAGALGVDAAEAETVSRLVLQTARSCPRRKRPTSPLSCRRTSSTSGHRWRDGERAGATSKGGAPPERAPQEGRRGPTARTLPCEAKQGATAC